MIPLATTTITIRRPTDLDADPTDAPSFDTIAAGIPAHVSAPAGAAAVAGGQQETVDATLLADTTDLTHVDLVDDDTTGETYGVVWARLRVGLGLDHMHAGLRRVKGATSG